MAAGAERSPKGQSGKASPSRGVERERLARPWGRFSLVLLFGLPLAALLLPSLLLLAVFLLPSLVASIVERRENRYLLLTVGLLNLCGALPPLAELWAMGQGLSHALQELRQPLHWLSSYGGAAVGWAVYLLARPLVAAWQSQRSAARLAELARYRERLEAAWGPEVAGPSKGGSPSPGATR